MKQATNFITVATLKHDGRPRGAIIREWVTKTFGDPKIHWKSKNPQLGFFRVKNGWSLFKVEDKDGAFIISKSLTPETEPAKEI